MSNKCILALPKADMCKRARTGIQSPWTKTDKNGMEEQREARYLPSFHRSQMLLVYLSCLCPSGAALLT